MHFRFAMSMNCRKQLSLTLLIQLLSEALIINFVLTRASDASRESILQFPFKLNRRTIFWSTESLMMIFIFEVTVSLNFQNTSPSKFPPDSLLLLRHVNKTTLSQQLFYILCPTGAILQISTFLCTEKRINYLNKGGKFLKKLWCCIGGEYYKIIWFYRLG